MKRYMFLLTLLSYCFMSNAVANDVVSKNPKIIELKLTETLQKIKKYKSDKNKIIVELSNELAVMKKKLSKYKRNKEYELKKVKKALRHSQKSLKHSRKMLTNLKSEFIVQKNNQNLALNKVKRKLNSTKKKLFEKKQELWDMELAFYAQNKITTTTLPAEMLQEYEPIINDTDMPMIINAAMEKAMSEPMIINQN